MFYSYHSFLDLIAHFSSKLLKIKPVKHIAKKNKSTEYIELKFEVGEDIGSEADGVIIKMKIINDSLHFKALEAEVIWVSDRWKQENEEKDNPKNKGYFIPGETIYLIPRKSSVGKFYFATSGFREHSPWFILAQGNDGRKYFAHYPSLIGISK